MWSSIDEVGKDEQSKDETAIREAHERGDLDAAVRAGLDRYQAELYSFLCARLRSESDAHEVFGQLTEDLWRGIARFRWQCSFRTWLYTLARHAAIRFERSPANQAGRRAGLSRAPEPAAAERTRTRPYLRTDVKDRFAALRATLSPDEQSLLILRVDRGLSWEEVARVMHDGDPAPATLTRQATNLRQRFRQLTRRLRQRASVEGLLDDEG
jgi:RNA polymerase sigma-70 factor (ECF subfamily)